MTLCFSDLDVTKLPMSVADTMHLLIDVGKSGSRAGLWGAYCLFHVKSL